MSSESTAVELEPFNVPAGTAVGAAMRELNYPNKGDDAVVCVQDAHGELKDLSHVPDTDATFMPVAANTCLLYTSPSPRDLSTSRMPSSA